MTGQSVLTYFTCVELQGVYMAHGRVHVADGLAPISLSMLSFLGQFL